MVQSVQHIQSRDFSSIEPANAPGDWQTGKRSLRFIFWRRLLMTMGRYPWMRRFLAGTDNGQQTVHWRGWKAFGQTWGGQVSKCLKSGRTKKWLELVFKTENGLTTVFKRKVRLEKGENVCKQVYTNQQKFDAGYTKVHRMHMCFWVLTFRLCASLWKTVVQCPTTIPKRSLRAFQLSSSRTGCESCPESNQWQPVEWLRRWLQGVHSYGDSFRRAVQLDEPVIWLFM